MQIKHAIKTMLILLPNVAMADVADISGQWDAYSRSSQAIYGKVIIDDSTVRWGVPTKAGEIVKNKVLPCKANYTYQFDENKQMHILNLINKACDYDNMRNAKHSQDLVHWEIKTKTNKSEPVMDKFRNEATFFEFKQNGEAMGSGTFYKHIDIE